MSDKSVMNVRQAAEFDIALARNGWTPADVKKLSKGTLLAYVRDLVREEAYLVQKEIVIDLGAKPFVPDGLSLVQHETRQPNFKWTGADSVDLHYDKSQEGFVGIVAERLRSKLLGKGLVLLNANVLDYLLARPHLIPAMWRDFSVYFWGTIYRDSRGLNHVRYLLRCSSGWEWRTIHFQHPIHGGNYAAVMKSPL